MIALSSVDQLVCAVRNAREVTFGAYVLHPGRLMSALEDAARAGVRLHVRAEAQPYRNGGGGQANAAAVARLRALGADAIVVDGLHFKGAVVDRALFLDDRNWADRGDTILRDDDPRDVGLARDAVSGRPVASTDRLAVRKVDALALEARVLADASANADIEVETESFSFGPQLYETVAHLAKLGRHVRLLVDRRDLAGNPRERVALTDLARDGVQIRNCASTEKFAVAGRRAWVGSANATYGVPTQRDWGIRTESHAIVDHLRTTFEANWGKGAPVLRQAGHDTMCQ
ncbi:MAG TPA: phospholipase D-like domain-containing protein [Verrucomicrobiae bacterium]|jgi:hypothetical protein|nr:phospholipase D-like domain-containing protein [Verrucomicrobiae bacterium]